MNLQEDKENIDENGSDNAVATEKQMTVSTGKVQPQQENVLTDEMLDDIIDRLKNHSQYSNVTINENKSSTNQN